MRSLLTTSVAGDAAPWDGFIDASAALQTSGYTFEPGGGGNPNYYDGDFADYDDDGLMDRVVLNRYGLLWNTGGGVMIPVSNQRNQASPANSQKNFTGFKHNLANGAGDDATQWADVDNDGDLDAVTGGNGENFIVQSNRRGRFSVKSTNLNSGAYVSAWQIVSTDLENDGDVDLSVSSGFPFDYSLLVNDGAGNFTDQAAARGLALANDPPQGTVSGDVDGDGDYDLVMLKGSRRVTPGFGLIVARNDGAGRFTRTLNPFARTWPDLPDVRVNSDSNQAMNLGDIDDDGDLDVVVALGLFFTDHQILNETLGSHPVVSHAIFINNGNGNFTEESVGRWDVTGYSGPILRGDNGDLVDVDYDGDLDFAALRRDSDSDIKLVQVYLNDGAGRFRYEPARSFFFPAVTEGFGNDFDFTDLDGDGAYDAWVGLAGDKVRILLNTYEDPAGLPADMPRNARVVARDAGGITLAWQAPQFASVARYYKVYRSTSPGLALNERELIRTIGERHQDEAFAAPITRHTTTAYLNEPDVTLDGANNEIRVTDRTAQPGVTYYYSVVHVGTENTASRPTPEVSGALPPPDGADLTPPHLVIAKPTADEWSQFPEIVLHYGDGNSGIDPASLRVSLNRALGTGDPLTGGRPADADISDLFFYRDGKVFISPFEPEMRLPSGSATLTVSVADRAGNRATRQRTFNVNVPADQLPVAMLDATRTADPAVFALSGAASSDSDGKVMRWEWYFPDGTTALGKDVTWLPPGPGEHEVELYVWDDRGGVAEAEVELHVASVEGTYLFYNRSAFDGNDPAANGSDDAAIAPDKRPLAPGQAPSFANVSSYSRGINGVMIDLGYLPDGSTLRESDFTFRLLPAGGAPPAPAPPPLSITKRDGAGAGGSDRFTLVWADGVIRNTWLQVTVNATAATALARPQIFVVGSLVGETGDSASPLGVSARDLVAVRRNLSSDAAPLTSRWDFNRDGRVGVVDLAFVRRNAGASLPLFTPPLPAIRPLSDRRISAALLL